MPQLRKRPAYRPVPQGITLAQARAILAGSAPSQAAPAATAAPPAPGGGGPPPGAAPTAPGPTPPARRLCAGRGCANIPMHDTPEGRLCATCHDRWRGHSDPGVSYLGGLLPWQGARPPEEQP